MLDALIDPGSIDPSAALRSVEQIVKLPDAMAAGNSIDVYRVVHTLLTANERIVVTTQPGSVASTHEAFLFALSDGSSATCTASSCLFDFRVAITYTGQELAGSITYSDDTLTLALRSSTNGRVEDFAWLLDGTVRLADGAITGTLVHNGSEIFRMQPGAASWSVSVDYGVLLDAANCPIGGSLAASTTYTDSRTTDSPSTDIPRVSHYDVSGSVSFGPACGDAR